MLGRTQSVVEWERLLDDSVNRRGAYDRGVGADAWHPEDALFRSHSSSATSTASRS